MTQITLFCLNHSCYRPRIANRLQISFGMAVNPCSAPLGMSSTLPGSEWAFALVTNWRQTACFLCPRTCRDISPGDNMLIYSAAGPGRGGRLPACNPPSPEPRTLAGSFNGQHQFPCYRQGNLAGPPIYKGFNTLAGPALPIELLVNDAFIFIQILFTFSLHSQLALNALDPHSAVEEAKILNSNQMKRSQWLLKWKKDIG